VMKKVIFFLMLASVFTCGSASAANGTYTGVFVNASSTRYPSAHGLYQYNGATSQGERIYEGLDSANGWYLGVWPMAGNVRWMIARTTTGLADENNWNSSPVTSLFVCVNAGANYGPNGLNMIGEPGDTP